MTPSNSFKLILIAAPATCLAYANTQGGLYAHRCDA